MWSSAYLLVVFLSIWAIEGVSVHCNIFEKKNGIRKHFQTQIVLRVYSSSYLQELCRFEYDHSRWIWRNVGLSLPSSTYYSLDENVMLTVSLKYFWKLTQLNKFLTYVDLLELIIGAMKKGRQNGAS